MLPLGSCPGLDLSGDSGRTELEGYWCRVEGWGTGLGWGFWASFEWPHSQYLTSNVNGFSDWILC